MGIRETQVMGLHERARELLEQGEVHSHWEDITRTYPDGRVERERREVRVPAVRTSDSGESFSGMFGERYPLSSHRMPDGTELTEAIQHEAWSSGPMIYLALRRPDGTWEPESLWPEDEMEGTEAFERARAAQELAPGHARS